jgi:hypothetical protein
MNTTNNNDNTMEATRQAIIADLLHSGISDETKPAEEKLVENTAPKPTSRSVKFFLAL